MKTLNLVAPNADSPKAFRKLLRVCVEGVPPEHEVDIPEMRRRCRVLDAFEALAESATELELEDDDAKCLVHCLKVTKWKVVSRDVLAFDDAVKAMMKVKDGE